MKKLIIACVLFLLLGQIPIFAQIWPKAYVGGTFDLFASAFETYDGGIIIGATKVFTSNSTEFIWIIKTDINGDTLWTRSIPNSSLRKIIPTSDNGILIIGNSDGDTVTWAPVAIKLNSCAEIEWFTFLSAASPGTYPADVIESSNQTYTVLCYGVPVIGHALIQLNQNGSILWTQSGYSVYDAHVSSLIETSDRGFLITGFGYLSNVNCGGLTLTKTDSLGQSLAVIPVNILFGGNSVLPRNTIQTIDGGFLSIGTSVADNRLFRLDSSFQPLWTKNYPLTNCSFGEIYAETDSTFLAPLAQCVSINLICHSQFFSIYRFNTLGDTIQTASFSNTILNDPYWGYSIAVKTFDNRILLGGCRKLSSTATHDHVSLLKLTSDLEIDTTFSTSGLGYDTLCVLPIVSSNVLLNQSATNLVENHEESENNFSIYPVPAEDFLIIKSKNDKLVSIRILTLTGQVVRETKLIDSNEIRIDVSQIISGIYLVELQTTIGTFIRRQIVF